MELIKVGLCAYGMSGRVFHAPFLVEHPGFFLEAIVERTQNKSKEKYPNAKIYRSVEEMLAEADIDLVVVNTPVQSHFEYVKMALDNGKHVIVEKPFTVNLGEAKALVSLAKEKGLSLSVYQNRRFDRDYLQIRRILETGKLGNIKEVEIRFDRYRTEPSGKEHKENPNLPGTGAWHDLGAHLVDQATQLFGRPEKVFGDLFSMKGVEYANDYFEVLLFYPNQLRVRLKSSVFTKEDHYAYKIFGENGCFLQERSDRQEAELKAGAEPTFLKDWTKPLAENDGILNYLDSENAYHREPTISKAGNYMTYYEDIYSHLVFHENLPSPAEEILQNMEIIDAAVESAKTSCVVLL